MRLYVVLLSLLIQRSKIVLGFLSPGGHVRHPTVKALHRVSGSPGSHHASTGDDGGAVREAKVPAREAMLVREPSARLKFPPRAVREAKVPSKPYLKPPTRLCAVS